MIGEIFKAILIMSLVGSVLTGVMSLFRPITKKIFGYSWHYYIWLCVLFVMLIPVRFNINPTSAPSIITQTAQTEQTAQQTSVGNQPETVENITPADTAQKPQVLQKIFGIWNRIVYNRVSILAWLWLIGAMLLTLLNIARYISLNVKIRKNGEIISLSEIGEYTNRKINVRVWESIASPFMTGVIKPTLILPKTKLSDEQLHNILCHEMTHFKRRDILYKCFAEFVKCVHWFNPVIWYVTRQIATECEISCDMAVTKNMSDGEKMSYINTILSLLPTGKSKQLPLTTQMASSKKILKRRFIMIKNKKTTSRFMSVMSAVIAVVMLSTTVLASGVLSDLATDNYTVEITNNGEKIELTNKPFIENGEVYVPLRELFEKMGIMSNPENYINWDNGKITVSINEPSRSVNGYSEYTYQIEIGQEIRKILSNPEPINFDVLIVPPVLKDSITYVQLGSVSGVLNEIYGTHLYKLEYNIFDKNRNDITFSVTDALETEKDLREMSDPIRTVELFFKAFYNQDFENMKRYCTQSCVDNFFGDDYVFGMKKATPLSIGTVDNLAEKGYTDGEWIAQPKVKMIPAENSVFDPNQTEISFYLILKQQDGRYLIDEFATGL
mgnify:FL=1